MVSKSLIHEHNERTYRSLAEDPKFKGLVISPSYLRLEKAVKNSQQTYGFNPLVEGNEVATEQKLDKNDLFVATTMGVFLYTRNFKNQNEGKFAINPFANTSGMSIEAGNSIPNKQFNGNHLNVIYNGRLNIKKGTKEIVENFQIARCKQVPEQSNGSGAPWNLASQNNSTGKVLLTPIITIPGREQISINMEFPTYNGITWENNLEFAENRIALWFDGFLIKGANI